MSKTQPIDVRDMAIVHRTFRAGYAESAQLVRVAPVPSPARVAFVADHIDFTIEALHIHHEGEDELLYPKLIERAPEQAPMTEEVEHEHDLVRSALEQASAACAEWRTQPSAETGEALAEALEHLNAVAQPHLDDEEQKIVPLASVILTQEEWDAIGAHAVARIPRDKQAIAFGMILDPLDDTERTYMKRVLPRPVRILYPFLIERPWKKYAATLRSET
ncbi:MAG TPA: hemerythrin domain-containing protein [Acidimicrobiia bacterium]|jgi:hemerythrin-like domain-containing protein|nr:hemerythrin domain-containing protein [Acidimicrobiia bacterium]